VLGSCSRTEEAEDGTEVEREIPFMKGYTVFNVDRDMPPTPARISR
jgi:antirestriction protein ArdC